MDEHLSFRPFTGGHALDPVSTERLPVLFLLLILGFGGAIGKPDRLQPKLVHGVGDTAEGDREPDRGNNEGAVSDLRLGGSSRRPGMIARRA
jgi:hypothetical protein